ncbi:MAG: hypothetical protein RL367_948 [Pseudomonadota bacterium]|jgi:hypothetical protein
MPDNEFKEERVVYDAPTYTLGQLLDEPETIPADIREELMNGLKKLLAEAEASGPARQLNRETFFAEMHRKTIGKA